jgi:hypothetical protein
MDRAVVIGPALCALLGCVPLEPDDAELERAAEMAGVQAGETPFCPPGYEYNAAYHLCEDASHALVPLTEVMRHRCDRASGGEACGEIRWSRELARDLRGQGVCVPGTSFDIDRGVCRSETDAYGPFSPAQVAQCRSLAGGSARVCDEMRWDLALLPLPGGQALPPDQPFCPAGLRHDPVFRLCHDQLLARGPFSRQLVAACRRQGGADCDAPSWPLEQARQLRGRSPCMPGTVWDERKGACREGAQAYGPFSRKQVARCITHSVIGSRACESMRWRASMLAGAAEPQRALASRRGAWLWRIAQTGHGHAGLAARLAQLGVRRIFVKTADGASMGCSSFGSCDPGLPDLYRRHGIEPWAWSYNYPANPRGQAAALRWAARTGYDGMVLDLEAEFDGNAGALTGLMQAFHETREELIRTGQLRREFPLYVTTWGNPRSHRMRVDIIDRYADGHMPQVYIEHWRGQALREPAWAVARARDEYQALGAARPVHAIVSVETGRMSADKINVFLRAAGPESSVWRVPGGGVPRSFWNMWEDVTWTYPDESRAESCVDPCGREIEVAGALHRGVPVRREPDAQSEIVAQAYAGAQYSVLEVRGSWLRIRLAEELSGWLHASFTDFEGAQ